jgi:hypothetical protein
MSSDPKSNVTAILFDVRCLVTQKTYPRYAHRGKGIGNRSNGHGFDSRQASHGKLTISAVDAGPKYRGH